MNYIKKLAGQTFVYGLSVILVRLINVVVTPIITRSISTETYGIFSNLYGYVAIFQVILAFGLETGYFRFVNSKEHNDKSVFNTVILFIISMSTIFMTFAVIFSSQLSVLLKFPELQHLIIILAIVLCIDAISAIGLAQLRQQNKAKRFAIINVSSVAIYVILVLLTLKVFPNYIFSDAKYDIYFTEDKLLTYVIFANLIQASFKFLLLSDLIFSIKLHINKILLKKLLVYSLPLLVIQVFGIMNQQLEKVMMPSLLTDNQFQQLGIYSANAKLLLFITLFNQMFRYAADPFFFSHKNDENAKQIYADVLKYFVIFGVLTVIIVNAYIAVFKYFIGPEFWSGLHIVPFILFAGLFNGIFYNLSFWYKLTDKNKIGILITGTGSIIFIISNIVLVPKIGYKGAAFAMLLANAVIVVFCYILGRRYYRIPYQITKIVFYIILGSAIVYGTYKIKIENVTLKYMVNTFLIVLFGVIIFITDKKEVINLFKKEKYVS